MKSIKMRRLIYKSKTKIKKIHIFKYIIPLIFIFIMFFIFNLYVGVFRPQVKSLAEIKAYNMCSLAVSCGVGKVLERENINYNDLITFIRDDEGEIKGVMTNLVTVNKLKSKFIKEINEEVSKHKREKISISLGSLSGNPFLSGMGPYIDIFFEPSAITLIDFKNSFEESGINQTKHEIYLEVKNTVSILIPDRMNIETKVTSKVPVIESIIVGEIPQSITRLETTNEKLRDDVLNLY